MIGDVTLVTQSSATHEASRMLELQIAHLTWFRLFIILKYKYKLKLQIANLTWFRLFIKFDGVDDEDYDHPITPMTVIFLSCILHIWHEVDYVLKYKYKYRYK